MSIAMNRRSWMAAAPAALALPRPAGAADDRGGAAFRFCLNTSTISGQKRPIAEVVDLVAKAGYSGIEPWTRDLDEHVRSGGSLRDLGRRIADRGLAVENVIGFFEWAVEDDARRRKALEQARRDMENARAIGAPRIAAPPVGLTDRSGVDLLRLAERYGALIALGEGLGIAPLVEVWGFSKTLGRLGEAALVAIESGHPKAAILPDVYHLYKGGSSPGGLRLLRGEAIGIFHFNDYPADPPRSAITDAQRVYPGDGVAPIAAIVRDLRAIGYRGALSLELFNRDYWQRDAFEVARTGLEKMKAAVASAP